MKSAIRTNDDDIGHVAVQTFEPLPIIDGERRLHVRAYQYWRDRADGRAMPTLGDCDDLQGTSFARRMMLIDMARDDRPSRIRTIGLELAAQMTAPSSGYLAGRGGLIDELITRLPALAMQRTPIGFEAETPEGGEDGCCFRGVLLPLADETSAISHVLGVMSWREIVATVPSEEIVAAMTSLSTEAAREQPVSPWSSNAVHFRAPPAPSTAQMIATAQTRVALAKTDKARTRTHLHAAVGAAFDASADLPLDERLTLLHSIFDGIADPAQIERTMGQGRLLAIGGQALARRLDAEPDGIHGFLERARSASANAVASSPARLHFRLAPLDPDLLAPTPRRDEESGDFPVRRAAG